MQVEMSLAELLMNAVGAGHVRGLRFKKGWSDEHATFEDLNRVISGKLENARSVAIESALHQLHDEHPSFKMRAHIRELEEALRLMLPSHSGSCCTFADTGKVIVTVESCRCTADVKFARAALSRREPGKP